MLLPVNKRWLETVAGRYNPLAFSLGETPDRIPVDPLLSMGHAANIFGVPRPDLYTDPELGVRLVLAANEFYGADAFTFWVHTAFWCEDYGGKIKLPTGYAEAPYIVEHPLKTREDIEKLEVKDVDEISKGPTMTKIWKALETAEKLLGRFFTPWASPYPPYELARVWLGSDKLLLWTIREPKLVHKLLRKVVEHQTNHITAVLRKYGRCSLGSLGSVFACSETISPEQFKEFQIPYQKETVSRALKAGAGPGIFYHLCGDHSLDWRLHEDLPLTSNTKMHVCYDGKKPMDLTEVIRVFGKKCIIQGNVPTELMLFGTPKQVYEEAKRQVIAYKSSPKGFVLSITCGMPPETPPVNVHALIRAAVDHGKLEKA